MSPYRFTEKMIQTEMALVTIQNLLKQQYKADPKSNFHSVEGSQRLSPRRSIV